VTLTNDVSRKALEFVAQNGYCPRVDVALPAKPMPILPSYDDARIAEYEPLRVATIHIIKMRGEFFIKSIDGLPND
jgi:hypothetical protein